MQKMVIEKVQKRSDQLSAAKHSISEVAKSQQALQSLLVHNGRSVNNRRYILTQSSDIYKDGSGS